MMDDDEGSDPEVDEFDKALLDAEGLSTSKKQTFF